MLTILGIDIVNLSGLQDLYNRTATMCKAEFDKATALHLLNLAVPDALCSILKSASDNRLPIPGVLLDNHGQLITSIEFKNRHVVASVWRILILT
ncbi:hypothetical protein G6F62_008973 [Rhizopus arrhizus]|nr:hypothetical protein G6F62_008973 [Rhizopus arrhizus]